MTEETNEKTYSIEELLQIRQQQIDILHNNPKNVEAKAELVCVDVLLCEEYVKDLGPAWKNVPLCEEICKYVPNLIANDYHQLCINVCERAGEVLFHHPRLKYRLLKLALDANQDAMMEPDFDLEKEVIQLAKNILAADAGHFDKINESSHLKSDPVEWTEAYESVIHLAEEKAYAQLGDFPRGMGFCHAYWPTLKQILQEDYNIRWRSPREMNPRVMFD